MNRELVKIFRKMAFLFEMENVSWKPRAYEKAAASIESLDNDINEIYKKTGADGLNKIEGIGKGISEKIEEFIKTGKIKEYENLRKKTPVEIDELNNIEGIGPKIIKTLYENLKIKNLDDLRMAAQSGKLKTLPRFGENLEAKILKNAELKLKSEKRFLLSEVLDLTREIEEKLKKIPGVEEIAFCGSIRRIKETVGDIDILVVSNNSNEVSEAFASLPYVSRVYAKGRTKTMVKLNSGIDADLRIVKKNSFGSAMQYFTGNKDHNIALRKIALEKGYKLNEYGLYKKLKIKSAPRLNISFARGQKLKVKKKWIQIAGKDEKKIYEELKMDFIPPELREMKGEIKAALNQELPKLIELKDIKGDLQIQTNWTDGANSIEEMARKAEELKYEYIAITDHTKSLAMTRGSDEKKLLKQIKEIEKINSKFDIGGVKILSGAEVNINKNGTLDIDDATLEKLDFVGASVHSHFRLSKEDQTNRLIKVMENNHIDIIFHPTGRIINKREPIELDMERIFETAAKTKTILEINGYPNRLDLKDDYIRTAKNCGIKFMINSDSHTKNQMRLIKYGIFQARRGWLEKKDVLNTLPLNELLDILKKPKNKRW